MLQNEIAWNDVSYILTMVVMLIGMYGCYCWGKRDGYYEGCRARRKGERFARRLMH